MDQPDERTRAPGLTWRRRKGGLLVPYWIRSDAAAKAGYPIRTVPLAGIEDQRLLVDRCRRLQAEMNEWIDHQRRGGVSGPIYDGTFSALFRIYETDPDSPFRELKPGSRYPYGVYLRKLTEHIGQRKIAMVDGRDVRRWFRVWSRADAPGERQTLAAAKMAFTVMKSAVSFGVTCRLADCAALKMVLDTLEFPSTQPRTQAPTAEQIIAARKAAHAEGAHGRALGYSLQFEVALRKWDVFGQWLPMDDLRPSAVLGYGQKWIGLTWNRIDDDLILRVTPTKTEDTSKARVAFDLKLCPMVLEELALIPPERRVGPVVLNENTGLPYRDETTRYAWRRDARAAGIPDDVWHRDIRAGAVTESSKAGTDPMDRSKVAGHTRVRTTALYDRSELEAHRRVATARISWRGGNE